jgi:hypothetical protein
MLRSSQSTRPAVTVNPQEFIAFCDGLEEAGLVEYARRGRALARDLIRVTAERDDERRLRVVMQEQRDAARAR